MNIPIILGTAREGRNSEKVANYVLALAQGMGITSELIDVRDYRLAATNKTGEIPEAKKLAAKIVPADALVIVMPEYNHSFPGELKMFLDMLFKEYDGKRVGICGVSTGLLGGARGAQSLRLALIGMKMVPIYEAVYFAKAGELFDPAGQIKDQSYETPVKGLLTALQKK